MVIRDYKNEQGKHVVDIQCRTCSNITHEGISLQDHPEVNPAVDDICSECKEASEKANMLYEPLWWEYKKVSPYASPFKNGMYGLRDDLRAFFRRGYVTRELHMFIQYLRKFGIPIPEELQNITTPGFSKTYNTWRKFSARFNINRKGWEELVSAGYVEDEEFKPAAKAKKGYFCSSCEYSKEQEDAKFGVVCVKLKNAENASWGCCNFWEKRD